MSPPCASSVTYFATGSSSDTSPCFTAWARSVAMNALPTEARLNSESEVMGDWRATSAMLVEEERAPVDVERDRHAARRDQCRLHLAAHQLLDLGIALRPRWDGGKRRADQQCHRGRHDAHLIPPVANASASLRANSTAAPRISELIRVHLTFPFVPAKAGTQGPHALALDPRLRGNERWKDRRPH